MLNAAAVLLAAHGNVPPERPAHVIGMLFGAQISAGGVDKTSSRLTALLGKAGLDQAMPAALAAEKSLAADETQVNVLARGAGLKPAGQDDEGQDPEEKDGKAAIGPPHVLIVRTPDGRLTWLQANAAQTGRQSCMRAYDRVRRVLSDWDTSVDSRGADDGQDDRRAGYPIAGRLGGSPRARVTSPGSPPTTPRPGRPR